MGVLASALRSALFTLWMAVTVVPWALAVLIASPFVRTPIPFVRSTKMRLRLSKRHTSPCTFGKVRTNCRTCSMNFGVASYISPPTRV